MRDRRLRQTNVFFDVAGAQAPAGVRAPKGLILRFATRGGMFERFQNATASRVGDGVKKTIEVRVRFAHASGIDGKSMDVNEEPLALSF